MKLSNNFCMTRMVTLLAKMYCKIYRGRWQHGSSQFICHLQKVPLYKVQEGSDVQEKTANEILLMQFLKRIYNIFFSYWSGCGPKVLSFTWIFSWARGCSMCDSYGFWNCKDNVAILWVTIQILKTGSVLVQLAPTEAAGPCAPGKQQKPFITRQMPWNSSLTKSTYWVAFVTRCHNFLSEQLRPCPRIQLCDALKKKHT